jgi:hypothetical protein
LRRLYNDLALEKIVRPVSYDKSTIVHTVIDFTLEHSARLRFNLKLPLIEQSRWDYNEISPAG